MLNKSNMVVLFNTMTNLDILDGRWEDLIDYYYEEFKWFYYLIREMDTEPITLSAVKDKKDHLFLQLKFDSQDEADRFFTEISEYHVTTMNEFDIEYISNSKGKKTIYDIKIRSLYADC